MGVVFAVNNDSGMIPRVINKQMISYEKKIFVFMHIRECTGFYNVM